MNRARVRTVLLPWLAIAAVACSRESPPPALATGAHPVALAAAAPVTRVEPVPAWVEAARTQIGVTVRYDPAYRRLDYPGGDVPTELGVCTDVVIRALRSQGLDLQQAVHEDMRRHFDLYRQRWGLQHPDRNIDHRRVPNLETWFTRQQWQLAAGEDYRAGDLVTWRLPGGAPHIGIVSDRRRADGTPLILHNINRGVREEDVLQAWPVSGHFRPRL
ncbi:DUF1287 domain-containing protein [Luteimonas sp. e5]